MLSSYIQQGTRQKETFKNQAKEQFRSKLIDYLNQHYDFKKIIIQSDAEEFIAQNFKQLVGKIYRPSTWKNEIIFATEKHKNNSILNRLSNCEITNFELI